MVKIAHYFENVIDAEESCTEKPKGFLMNATQTPHPFNGWMFLTTENNLLLMPQEIAVPWKFEREIRGKHKAEHIDYFISYRRDGGATNARLLYEVLRLRGLHGFIDTEKLAQGNYSEAITQNIRIAKNFILVVSPGALDSEWVIKEIKEALDSGCKIIPVFTDGTKCFPANLPVDIAKLSDNNAITLDHSNFEEKFKQLIDWLETPHVKLVNACFGVWKKSENGVKDMIEAWTSISGTNEVFEAIQPVLRKVWQGSSDEITTSEVLSSIGTRDLKKIAKEIGVEHKGNRATLLENINDRLRGEKIHLIDEDRKNEYERYYRVMAYMAEFSKSGDKLQRLKKMVDELKLDPDNKLSSRPLMEAIFDSPKFESVDKIFEILDLDANEIKSICAEFVGLEGRAIAGFRTQFRAWVDYEDRSYSTVTQGRT